MTLVSCLMPTSGRRPFVPLAVQCFLEQNYEPRELIVLDDGDEPVGDLIPADPRIRYERLDTQLVLGAKRNLAARMARGEVLAHWDDDDWSAPTRLSAQVEALQRHGAEIVGLDELWFFDALEGRAWRYAYPSAKGRPWVAGGTMCYLRRFWERHPFPEIGLGEDSRFVWTGSPRVHALKDLRLYAATIHPGNSSLKRPKPPRWQPVSAAELAAVLGEERLASYRVAANGAVTDPRAALAAAAAAAAPQATDVTVTIPYHRCRPYIAQCVEGVLAQTHRNLTVIVVNDGDAQPPWDLLAHIDDPRLVRFDLPTNRGRYFADQVVLQATRTPYLFVHDADDHSDPQRLAALLRALRAEHANAAIGAAKPGPRVVHLSRLSQPPPSRLTHLTTMHGLFQADALRAIGGFYAGFRVGYDTFLINAMLMTGRIAAVPEPLYNWRRRPDSLTVARTTGGGSVVRRTSAHQLRELHRAAYTAYAAYVAGEHELEAVTAKLREITSALVEPSARRDLDRQSARLAALLDGEHEPPPRRPLAVGPRRAPVDIHDVLEQPPETWSGWALTRATAVELAARLERRAPRTIVEAGSGVSTAVLAQYAARTGAKVVTLEHEARYADRTRRLLQRLGLQAAVDVRTAPLVDVAGPDGTARKWYSTALPDAIDFALIDGPPLRHGRAAGLLVLKERLAPEWEAWLHDAGREHERECVRLWQEHVPLAVHRPDLDEKGVALLGPDGSEPPAPEPPLPGLGVAILTGGRPDLLRRTLAGLEAHAGPALAAAHVMVLVNGRDPASERLARAHGFVDRVLTTPRRLTVGPATSLLLRELIGTAGVELVLHVEDDWGAFTLDSGWLLRSARLLADEPRVGQIRLRHVSENVWRRHAITREPIDWARSAGVARSAGAHLTFNPNLMRAADVARVFPAGDEPDAQRHYLATGLGVAQLSPGVFRHLGEGRTLRRSGR